MQLGRQHQWPQDDAYVEQTKPKISTVGGNGGAITVCLSAWAMAEIHASFPVVDARKRWWWGKGIGFGSSDKIFFPSNSEAAEAALN